MSVYDAAFVNSELSKPTSIFGLHLWVVIGILVGSLIVLTLFLLSLCLTARHRHKSKLVTAAAQKPSPIISKDIQEIIHPNPEVHVEIGKPEHRVVVFSDQRGGVSSGESRGTLNSETASFASGNVVGPEVSHLGWGRWYTLRELEAATNGLCEENVIGEGGYGIVYSGILSDGTEVAVKNLLNNRGQAEKEFKVEVEVIGRVRHKNLVRLLGYCVEGAYRMLVYEYVDNGNLDQWLHGDVGEVSPLTRAQAYRSQYLKPNPRTMAMEACSVSPTSFFTIFSIILSVFIAFSDAQSTVPAIYIFGDSLLDVGNNNYLTVSVAKANFPHNGIDFPTKKATGRFSNGKNSADFLAEKVGLPTSPPYLSLVSKSNKQKGSFVAGVSFASGGAGIFNGTDDEYRQSLPLTKQVGYYAQVCAELQQQLGTQAAQAHLAKSLHVVLIGSNDVFGYLDSSNTQKQYTPDQYVSLMLSTLKQHLQRIHSLGARKFVILGTGPVGCCPARRSKTGDCNELGNSISLKYSDGLKSMMQQLKPALGINYSFFETYSIFRNIVQTPSSYGFNETKAACCGLGYLNAKVPCLPVASYCSNRRDHMFWDLFHPTEATHKILVEHLFEGSAYSFPMNVKKLVSL